MGAFALIEGKQYEAFCSLYEEKAHLRKERAEFADLMPGNYAVALLGAGRYEAAADFCRRQIAQDRSGAREAGDMAAYRDRLQEAVGMYAQCPAVVMELSCHLAELCLTKGL